VGHLEHKNDIIVNLTLQLQKFLFLIPVLVTYISKNRAANFVEICNIYTNQIINNVAISTINSNKLSHNYDQMYLVITFCNTGYIGKKNSSHG